MEQQLALLILEDLNPCPPTITRRASPPHRMSEEPDNQGTEQQGSSRAHDCGEFSNMAGQRDIVVGQKFIAFQMPLCIIRRSGNPNVEFLLRNLKV